MSPRKRNEGPEPYYNRSLERALSIMGAFDSNKKSFTLAQLAEAVGLPKPTIMRLCSTLIKYDFMKYDPASMRYALGMKLFELGNVVASSLSLKSAASPHLLQLQVRSAKTSFLAVLQNDELVYIDKKEDLANLVRLASDVGTRRPPYFGMFGQLLLAYLPDNEVDRILAKHPLAALTRRSITDPFEFRERLAKVKEQGYVIEEGEAIDGVTGIGAPVRDHNGNVVAAVGVGFISSSVEEKNIQRTLLEVRKTAALISRELGFTNDDDSLNHVPDDSQ